MLSLASVGEFTGKDKLGLYPDRGLRRESARAVRPACVELLTDGTSTVVEAGPFKLFFKRTALSRWPGQTNE